MGYYINPKNETKESFLAREGVPVNLFETEKFSNDEIFCCLVDNGIFTAAVICYDQRELDEIRQGFLDGSDCRPYQFYRVQRSKLDQWFPKDL